LSSKACTTPLSGLVRFASAITRLLALKYNLLNIFGYCYAPHTRREASNRQLWLEHAAHILKEPALDVLWSVLDDLSALAQCLPEASHRRKISQANRVGWFQVFVSLCLVVKFSPALLPSVIRSADHLQGSGGVSFGVRCVASDSY
jgi:hypothetical protein